MKKLLLFLLPVYLFSCIQVVDGTTVDGGHVNALRGSIKPHRMKGYIESSSANTRLEYILKNVKIDKLSPIELKEHNALILLLGGDYNSSIESLHNINKEEPNRYTVASNLGTAYELNGDNEKALKWIQKGININSKSHYGSEWLHVLILKRKIELQKNPKYLESRQIIPLPKEFNLKTKITIDNKVYTVKEIKNALEYQLKERVIFIKPKNDVVASLFYSLARISAQTFTVENGLEYLKLAQQYGFTNKMLLDETKSKYIDIIDNHSFIYKIKAFFHKDFVEQLLLISLLFFIALLIVKGLTKTVKKIYKFIKKDKNEKTI